MNIPIAKRLIIQMIKPLITKYDNPKDTTVTGNDKKLINGRIEVFKALNPIAIKTANNQLIIYTLLDKYVNPKKMMMFKATRCQYFILIISGRS